MSSRSDSLASALGSTSRFRQEVDLFFEIVRFAFGRFPVAARFLRSTNLLLVIASVTDVGDADGTASVDEDEGFPGPDGILRAVSDLFGICVDAWSAVLQACKKSLISDACKREPDTTYSEYSSSVHGGSMERQITPCNNSRAPGMSPSPDGVPIMSRV